MPKSSSENLLVANVEGAISCTSLPASSTNGTTDKVNNVEFALSYYRHLRHLRNYVISHANEAITLTEIAKDIGISASRLSHLFHEKTGVKFSDWLREYRVEQAKLILKTSDRCICDVAEQVGYRSVRSFERAFLKITGKSASVYRKSMLAQKVTHM